MKLTLAGTWSQINGEQKTFRVAQDSDCLQRSAGALQHVAVLRGKCKNSVSQLPIRSERTLLKLLILQSCIGGWLNGYNLRCEPVDYSYSPKAIRVSI